MPKFKKLDSNIMALECQIVLFCIQNSNISTIIITKYWLNLKCHMVHIHRMSFYHNKIMFGNINDNRVPNSTVLYMLECQNLTN